MAKLSSVLKNKRRAKTAEKFAKKRRALKETIRSPKSSQEVVDAAYKKLMAMPRDASATRTRNRCELTGRPRAYIRKFGLCRLAMRSLALSGELPGVTKSSW